MPANVETMAYNGTRVPWHGIGQRIEEAATAAVAMAAAGLGWTASLKPMWIGAKDDATWKRSKIAQSVVRDTDKRELGVVGFKYDIFQPFEAFAFLDSLVEEGRVEYHTAGSLNHGKRIWVLAKVAGAGFDVVPGDAVECFLLLTTSYDGSGATICVFTTVRVVCANTLAMALGERRRGVRIPHTRNQRDRLEDAREVLGFATRQAERSAAFYRALAQREMTDAERTAFVETVIPSRAKVDDDGEEVESKHVEREREKLRDLVEAGTGAELSPGTAWSALNGASEYTSHVKTARTPTSRFTSTFVDPSGVNAQINDRALQFVHRLVA